MLADVVETSIEKLLGDVDYHHFLRWSCDHECSVGRGYQSLKLLVDPLKL